MPATSRPLAVVTGASAGIGYELAMLCARNGFDLVVAADQPKIAEAAQAFRALGVEAEPVEADLATLDGVGKLYGAIRGRPVAALLANAATGSAAPSSTRTSRPSATSSIPTSRGRSTWSRRSAATCGLAARAASS